MEKLSEIIYKYRYFFVGAIAVITLILGLSIQLHTENSFTAFFSPDDSNYTAYEEYIDVFEEGKYLIIAMKSKNIFSLEILEYIKQKTSELEFLPFVVGVHSLSNANKIIGTSDGVEIHPLLSDLESNNIQKIRQYSLEDEIFRNYLISKDGEYSALLVAFEYMPSEKINRAVHQIESIMLIGKPENVEIYFSGDRKALAEFNRYTAQTLKVFPVIIISMIGIALFILFRSLYKCTVILVVIGMSLIWALGFYSLLGFTLNVVTGMLVPLVIVLSIADCIHIIKFYEEVKTGSENEEAFKETIKYISNPCFITSITTSAGLISLSISRVTAVRYFGIGSASGIMFAFIISIIVVPFLLVLFPSHNKSMKNRKWKQFLIGISTVNERRFKLIMAIASIVLMISFWGITKVRIETNQLEWVPKKGDFYNSAKIVEHNLFGIDEIAIVLKGKEDDLKNPEILKKIDRLGLDIEKLPNVKKVISLANYVKRIHKTLNGDNPDYYVIPETQALIAQELFLFNFSDFGRMELEKFVTSDYSQGRISVKTVAMPSEECLLFGQTLEVMAGDTFNEENLEIYLTGTSYLRNTMQKYLLDSQIRCFTLAFLIVIGFLFIAFHSFKYGALSVLPNVLPIALILGIMGWSGLSLNVATIMVASTAIGIAVDDTVHFISRFKKLNESTKLPTTEILRKTTVLTGQAIIFTTAVNVAGFLVFFLSGFQPVREFGILISLTLFFALVGDLLILPASILTAKNWLKNQNTV